MALTDIFVRTAISDKPTGQKYADGNGMYLLVTPSGKYWRLDYRHLGKESGHPAMLGDFVGKKISRQWTGYHQEQCDVILMQAGAQAD